MAKPAALQCTSSPFLFVKQRSFRYFKKSGSSHEMKINLTLRTQCEVIPTENRSRPRKSPCSVLCATTASRILLKQPRMQSDVVHDINFIFIDFKGFAAFYEKKLCKHYYVITLLKRILLESVVKSEIVLYMVNHISQNR